MAVGRALCLELLPAPPTQQLAHGTYLLLTLAIRVFVGMESLGLPCAPRTLLLPMLRGPIARTHAAASMGRVVSRPRAGEEAGEGSRRETLRMVHRRHHFNSKGSSSHRLCGLSGLARTVKSWKALRPCRCVSL